VSEESLMKLTIDNNINKSDNNYFSKVSLSIFIIATNVVIFILISFTVKEEGIWKLGSLNHSLITYRGEYFRFITAIFLHAHGIHILFNMFALFMVGQFIEKVFGLTNFFILYMVSGLGSTLSSYFITMAPESIGASGSIYGIIGGLTTFLIAHKSQLKPKIRKSMLINLLVVIGLNLVFGFTYGDKFGIDNAGHVGGLVCGIVTAFFLKAEVIYGKVKGGVTYIIAYFFIALVVISTIWCIVNYFSIPEGLLNWNNYFE
jgi:rhomboid protease GluP